MQTIKENQINFLVFPYVEFTTGSLPQGDKIFLLYAYQTMENDTGSFTFQSASVIEKDERWRVATADIQTSGSDSSLELRVEPGTTYEIELWFGIEPGLTWGTTTTLWGQTSINWSDNAVLSTPHIVLNKDTMFISGSVLPQQKLYISSNETAVLKIYQG